MADQGAELTRVEKAAVALGRLANETPGGRRAQWVFHQGFTKKWVAAGVRRRCYVEGIDWLVDHEPDRGVLIASNHRSFFDQYVMMLSLYEAGCTWAKNIMFPVRSTFFYDKPLGVLINLMVGAVTMYPPIFRDPAKSEHTKDSLDRVINLMQRPGTVVGVHPEGTRGKGPDPYEMLPAKPGVGEMVLKARPLVVPVWINGLGNDFVADVRSNFRSDIRRTKPVIMNFGRPVDYSSLLGPKPRPTLYLKCARLIRDDILALAPRERELRAQCEAGQISDDDPNWLENRARNR